MVTITFHFGFYLNPNSSDVFISPDRFSKLIAKTHKNKLINIVRKGQIY